MDFHTSGIGEVKAELRHVFGRRLTAFEGLPPDRMALAFMRERMGTVSFKRAMDEGLIERTAGASLLTMIWGACNAIRNGHETRKQFLSRAEKRAFYICLACSAVALAASPSLIGLTLVLTAAGFGARKTVLEMDRDMEYVVFQNAERLLGELQTAEPAG
jgi:hypothetical protein